MEEGQQANIPVLAASAFSLAETWERSLVALHSGGCDIKTQYDKPEDPPSKDCTMIMCVQNPLSEPMIHLDFPGGPEDLQEYVMEVTDGIKDHLVRDPNDPEDTRWEYCVHPETPIMMEDYSLKRIKDVSVKDRVLSLDTEIYKIEPSDVIDKVTSRCFPIRIKIRDCEPIIVSGSHPLYLCGFGWVKSKQIKKGDLLAVYHGQENVDLGSIDCGEVIVTRDDILAIPFNMNKERIIKELEEKNLLPFELGGKTAAEVVSIMGYLFGDGWLSSVDDSDRNYGRGKVGFSGEFTALLRIRKIIMDWGFSCERIRPIHQSCKIEDREVSGTSLTFSCGHTSLWALFYCLGVPTGRKNCCDYKVPFWIKNSNDLDVQRCFLNGFADAEMSAPSKKTKGIGTSFYLRQNKNIKLKESLSNLMIDLIDMYSNFGIVFHPITTFESNDKVSMGIRIGDRKYIDLFVEKFSFPFSFSKQCRVNMYLKYRDYCYALLKENDAKNLSYVNELSPCELLGDNIHNGIVYSEVELVEVIDKEIDLIDISVDHKDHNFIGSGVYCHNTYHQRLFEYTVQGGVFDQIESIAQKLAKSPYTRRAQAITWKVDEDNECYDPACFVAGSKVSTPNGFINIENIKNGDTIYAWDLEKGLMQREVSHCFSKKDDCLKIKTLGDYETEVSLSQNLLTENGWSLACDIDKESHLFVSSATSGYNVNDSIILGYFLGDGWISSGYCGGERKISRCVVSFGMHPKCDDTWVYEYLSQHTGNKINCKEKFIRSELVPNGGDSKKIEVTDKLLWEKLKNLGVPVGKKKNCEVCVELKSKQEKKDFLTGIFSAEGSVVLNKLRPSIQLGMNWTKCVDFVSSLLSDLKIVHTIYDNGDTRIIHIDSIIQIEKCFDVFDFRLDSRKQAKYLAVKASIQNSREILIKRMEHIDALKKAKKEGVSINEIKKVKPWNSRMLDEDYEPSLRFKYCSFEVTDIGVYLPVISCEETGTKDVYDFEVDHKDHAMIVNGIISHNCLQSIWSRIIEDKNGLWFLNTNVRFHSNDAYKAAFMNMFALTMLQKKIAERVSELADREVRVGRYCHMVDSYHLYGSYFEEFEGRFIKNFNERKFEDRTANYEDWKDIMEESRPAILKKIEDMGK